MQDRWIGLIDDEQWARLEIYGPFVKRMEVLKEDDDDGPIGAGFYALVVRARGQPIFPHLSRVGLISLTHMRTYEPLFLLSTGLRDVKFTLPVRDREPGESYPCKMCRDFVIHEPDETMGPLLQLLHLQSPDLAALSINFDGSTYPEADVDDMRPIRFFSALKHLHVEIGGMSLHALLQICSEIKQLSSLSLHMSDDDLQTPIRKKKADTPAPPPLRTLTDLKIRGHPAYAQTVLEYASPSPLQSLLFIGPLNTKGWKKVLDSLTKHFSDSVVTLGMTLYGQQRVRFADIGDKLHALPNLQQCFLEFVPELSDSSQEPEKIPVSLTDDDIAKAARAWPRLRKFVLSCEADEDAQDGPSAEILDAFRQNCPDLTTLVVSSIEENAEIERKELRDLNGDLDPDSGGGFAFIGYVY